MLPLGTVIVLAAFVFMGVIFGYVFGRREVWDSQDLYGQNVKILEGIKELMDNTDALTAAVGKLGTDVDALLAKPAASVQPAIDAATAAVTALDAKVVAATGA